MTLLINALTPKLVKHEKDKIIVHVYLMGDFNINLFNADTHTHISEFITQLYIQKKLFPPIFANQKE